MELRLDLVLPTEAAGVPIVRRLLHGCLHSLDVDPDTAADVELALSEACANVARHAGGARPYTVSAVITARRCELKVADHGSGFPATTLARAGVGPEAESGRGLPLMRSLLDDLRFTPAPGGGTIAWLTKHLRCCPLPGVRTSG